MFQHRFLSGTFSFLMLSLLLYACSGGDANTVTLKKTNIYEEQVALQQNITFTFDKEMVSDSLLELWDTTNYVSFTPKVKGTFKWVDKDRLVFSPEFGYKPSTDYTAKVNESVLKHASENWSLSAEDIKFHTPYLAHTSTESVWIMDEISREIKLKIGIGFNYEIKPTQLKSLMKIKYKGKNLDFSIRSSSESSIAEVTIANREEKEFDGSNLDITIAPGLACVGTTYETKEEIVTTARVPYKDKFAITSVTSRFEVGKGIIEVHTNQGIMPGQSLASLIQVEPKAKYTVTLLPYGLQVEGDFESNETYELTIKKSIKGIFGSGLEADHEQVVTFGEVEPTIGFEARNAIYLTSAGNKNIPVQIAGVEKVQVKIIKIYENNILQFLDRTNDLYNYGGDDYYYYDDYYYGNDEFSDLGDKVLDKEYEVMSLPKSGNVKLLNLDFDDLDGFKGIYSISVRSTDDRYLKARKTVAISDVGMIVKSAKNDVYVFANSIMTTDAISGADVRLISDNNQTIYSAKTDANGVATFKDLKSKAPNFTPKMVTVRYDGDFTYTHFTQTSVDRSRFDVSGYWENSAGYQAFIYGERDLYRPGETAHFNTIVRDKDWGAVKGLPVKVLIKYPNGKEYKSFKGKLNDQGAFEEEVTFPAESVTGSYTIELYTSNDVYLTGKTISVEEFMPDRIKVDVQVDKKSYDLGEEADIVATATNFFGPPASNRNFEMDLQLSKKYFHVKEFSDYVFSLNGKNTSYFDRMYREGKTDAQGKANEAFELPETYKNRGLLQGRLFTTVFDESGRPVNRINLFNVYTQDIFYGIKDFDYYVGTNKTLRIPVVALSKEGKPLAAKGSVEIIKYEWHTVLEKSYNNSFRYVSREKEKTVYQREINITGTATEISFTPSASGRYEIRLRDPEAETYVKRYFYAYGWGSTTNTSFEVDRDGEIKMETDKKSYQPGETAKVLLKTPFQGKVLVTVERDDVLYHEYVMTDKKSAQIEIPIKDNYLPNVFVSATLIKPHSDGAIPLTVAHGYTSLIVEKPSNKIGIEITAAKKSRSRTKQEICIKGTPNTEITVAVVDEGILQMKDYKTPDPYGYFYQKRGLSVYSYDIYPRLFPEMTVGTQAFGSGAMAMEAMAKRVNPLANNRVQLVSFWSGILKTDGDGKACYTIDIPQFSGDLRIMAVAYKDQMFGSGDANMKVADPVVISTALPRFLSPRDTILIPLMVTNTTSSAKELTASIDVKGTLKVMGSTSQKVSVAANSESRVFFKAYAKPEVGQAEVVVKVKDGSDTYLDETSITVRPPAGLLKNSESGAVTAGNTIGFDLENEYIPSSVDAKLVVSKSPMVQFTEDLEYLVQYPYGCVEQTTSAAFPQLYFTDMMKSMGIKKMVEANPRYNIQQAIIKLQSMQLYNGALSYWQGSYNPSWWGTVYATHFLLEAKKAGYDVDQRVLNRLKDYLKDKAGHKSTETYWYYDESGVKHKKYIIPKSLPYSLYVLALADDPHMSAMNHLSSNLDKLSLDGKYLLASAYFLAGDRNSYQKILPRKFTGERSMKQTGGSFYSFIRDEAIALNALLEVDPQNLQIPTMARHLTKQMKQEKWLSTQERSFAMLALGKLSRKTNDAKVTGTVKVNGQTVGNYTGETLTIDKGLAGKEVTITAQGSGELYYFWQIEGISKNGDFKEEDNVLRVRKQFLSRDGNTISLSNVEQNDLIVVRISASTIDNSSIENVVITDLLPAGFEIENPRLTSLPGMTWLKDVSSTDHQDIRDDRINLFTTVDGKTRYFYYMVRAVSPGEFIMGPVSADAMYNGEYRSYHGAGKVNVKLK